MSLIETVKGLIARSDEEDWFEFKENWYKADGIGEYISALSNAAAECGEEFGYLIWGVRNDDHALTDTTFNFNCDVKNEPLQHYLARNIKPDINFRFKEEFIDGNRLVVLIIPAAKTVPTEYNRVRYVRIGSSKEDLRKFPDREAYLFSVLRHGIPTIENTESEYQDLTFNKLFVYYASKKVPINKKTFKKNLGLLTENGKYNLMAQLLSDNSHIPIRFSVFNGNDKTSSMYLVREFGNDCILLSLDKILEYGRLLNEPQADEKDRKTTRNEVPLFSEEAFSEAVINSIVHNHWVEQNAPSFTAYKDRLEILSRGNLPPKQTMEGFFLGESVPVNRKLSDIFLQLHISERSGRGIPRIVGKYGRDAIEFRDNTILVTIPFDRLQQDMGTKAASNTENRNDRSLTEVLTEVLTVKEIEKVMPIAEYLEIHGEITPKEAELLVKKSTKTVYRYMTMLVGTGKVVREGETNQAIYRLIK